MKTNFTLFNLREIAKWARLIVALIAFISIAQISQAQSSRFNNWYFGNNAGVSFASGSPVALTNGQLSTTEGCATISDASGNLMFYTNGISVWNRNHAVMSNGTGLLGHTSSTQSAIIVQKPLSTNIYYIFTADADVGANGIRYSEVNMSLAGGLGAVTANKNILLRTPSSEKLTAVRHCNNRDLWIVTHDWSSNGFRTWLVTPTGVNTTPVTSSAGTVINGINQSAYGQLKSNPDGNKLLAGYYGLTGGGINKFELYDFNNSTGVVSNAITLATETGAYGCEFSPNGRIAYGGTNGGRLVQFDLCSGNAATIQASKYVVGVLGPFIGSMQLGPDGKVYVSRNATSLSVINNPNTYGAGCNFVNAAVSLAGRGSTMGLPNMASFYMRPEVLPFTYAANCLNVSFTSPSANSSANSCASATSAIVGAQWNFNDPSSGASNTSTTLNASHTFSSTGVYQVQLILNLGCYYDTIIQPVNVTGFTLNTSSTNASCGTSNGTSTATPAIAGMFSYAWSNGQTTQTATGLSAGNYTVLVTSTSGCSSTASVTVASSGSLTGTVSKTNVACFGNATGTASASASGGTAPYTYAWSNGATGVSVSNLAAGNYSVVMSDASGCSFIQSIVITQPTALAATTSFTNAACYGGLGSASVSASGGTSPYTYAWSNGQSTSSVNSLASGNYSVVVSDANGCSVNRTATVSQPTALSISLTSSAIICNGSANGSLTSSISGGTLPYSYVWSNASTASQIQNLSPGTYTLTVTDAASCSANATSTLTQPAAISVNTSSTNASCGSTNGTAIATPASAGVYTYLWSNGQTTQTATGLAGGNYTVTITASNSCTASASVTVGSSGSVTGTVSKTDVACFGNSAGTATANATGGTAPYTYVWSNGATSASVSNLIAGNYSVVMSDASGCSYTQAIVISQPTALSVSLNASAITCNGSANGSLTSSVSGGTSPYSYVWSNASSASQIQNLSPGTFTLTVTDAASCSATATSTLTQPAAISVNTSSTNASCGSSNGTATVTPVIAGVYTYSWSNGQTIQTATGLTGGNYTVTMTDANSCSATASVTVGSSGSVTGTVSKTDVACFGNSTGTGTANASGGTAPYSYVWSNGATSASISNLAAGNYSVVMSDASGCSFTQTIVISQPTVLDATASSSNAACFGGFGSATVIAIGGTSPYSYVWTNGQTTSSVTSLLSGNYTVLVSDANGCSVNRSAMVSEPIELSISLTSYDITCNGLANGSIISSVSGGNSPYSYVWTNASSASQIQNLSPGTFTLTVTDAASCSATASSTLIEPTSLTVNTSSTNASCGSSNGTATASLAGAGVYSYLWSDGQTTQTATGLSGGNYTVTITASNSCTASASFTVGSSGSVTGTVSKTDVVCFGNSTGAATANASGGMAPYTYIWSNGSTSASVSNLSAGNYSVVMSDASGCTFTQAIVISQPTIMSLTSSASPVSCYGGSNGSAQLIVSGGTQPYLYSWNNGTSNANISNVSAGTYSSLVTDANGCESNSQVIITAPAQLTATANIQHPSCNAANGSIQLNVQGGVGTYSYLWNSGGVNSTLSGLLAGNYQVTITDQNACSISMNESLVSTPPFSVFIDGDTLLCAGEETQLSARTNGIHNAYSYFWDHGVTGADFMTNPSETTIYTVTVQDTSGCVAQDSITIHVNQIPVVSIVADANEGCVPFCTSLHAVSLTATTFNWNLSNGAFYSGAVVFPCFSLPGSYTIEMAAKDDAGCSAIINWDGVIQVNASPQAIFTVSDSDVSLDEPTIEFNNHSIGANNYTYFFGDSDQGTSYYSNISYTYRDSGNYEVMLVVENTFGCTDTAFHTIHVGGLTSFYIPTSFSPSNTDGLNDVFMPKSIGMSETGYTMSIYDRWGHLVFESNSWAKGWDGFNNGTPVQQDVYVCKVRYRELSGRINEAIGSVTVAE